METSITVLNTNTRTHIYIKISTYCRSWSLFGILTSIQIIEDFPSVQDTFDQFASRIHLAVESANPQDLIWSAECLQAVSAREAALRQLNLCPRNVTIVLCKMMCAKAERVL